MKKTIIGFGLQPTPEDKRDFNYVETFGAIPQLPEEDFLVGNPIKIKNQGNSDMCVAFSCCAVSELQEGVELSPEFQFALIKQGSEETWGADLRAGCKSFVKYGSMLKAKAEYDISKDDRDTIVHLENWEYSEDEIDKYKKMSYFKVDSRGYKDLFDSFRGALWQNKKDKRGIVTGCIWRLGWENNEIISEKESIGGYGHAFAIIGQKTINNKIYLVAQLSNGEEIGSEGLFYFPREVVNRDFKWGGYMFIDIEPEVVKKKQWTIWQKISKIILRYSYAG